VHPQRRNNHPDTSAHCLAGSLEVESPDRSSFNRQRIGPKASSDIAELHLCGQDQGQKSGSCWNALLVITAYMSDKRCSRQRTLETVNAGML